MKTDEKQLSVNRTAAAPGDDDDVGSERATAAVGLPPHAGELSKRALFLRDVFLVLAVAWAARILFMLIVPPEARSFDVTSWEAVAKTLESGGNPYQETSWLNWPPFWMQLIYVISKTAAVLGIPFLRALQIFLVLIESFVIIGLFKLVRAVAPAANARKIIIIGLALNPVAILLVCLHCNFDILVALWLVLFMDRLLRYNRHNETTDWLAACLFLGLGVLTKTVPLILVPLLAGGFRRVTPNAKFLGLNLLFGPVALGMSVIYVLAPIDVTAKVIAYQSIGGFFGISGLLHLAGIDTLITLYSALFCLLLVVVMTLSSIWFWRRQSIGDRETILFGALLLAAIPALGPGYGPQYIYWFLPFLIVSYAACGGYWRWILTGFWLTSVGTYLVEYALFQGHGMYLYNILAHAQMMSQAQLVLAWGQKWSTHTGQTLVRLPLFVAYLVLLVSGASSLFRNVNREWWMGGSAGTSAK
jgi:hypothetical protein